MNCKIKLPTYMGHSAHAVLFVGLSLAKLSLHLPVLPGADSIFPTYAVN